MFKTVRLHGEAGFTFLPVRGATSIGASTFLAPSIISRLMELFPPQATRWCCTARSAANGPPTTTQSLPILGFTLSAQTRLPSSAGG